MSNPAYLNKGVCYECGKESNHIRKNMCLSCYRKQPHILSVLKKNRDKYYQNHREEILSKSKPLQKEKNKKYYIKNKDKIIEESKKYYYNNKKKILSRIVSYTANKRKNNQDYNLKCKIKRLVNFAFHRYSTTGKVLKSREYGIDYEKIILQLGKQPTEEYHIDHIIPLILFDLNNKDEIRIAFHPENHQWLRAELNLQKSRHFTEQGRALAQKICPELYPLLLSRNSVVNRTYEIVKSESELSLKNKEKNYPFKITEVRIK